MVLFFTSVLIISSVAMAALLYVKHWELTTGKVVFQNARPAVGNFSHRVLFFFEKDIPALLRLLLRSMTYWLRTSARAALAHALVYMENGLERALHALRHGTVPPEGASGQASAFLREVAEHKKTLKSALVREHRRANASLEE